MTRLLSWKLYGILIVLVPSAVAAGWWSYWPVYRQHALRTQAERAIAAERWELADELLVQLAREHPEDPATRLRHAHVLRRLERYEEAGASLGKAAELGLSREAGRRDYGLIYAELDFPVAQGALEQELKDHPDDTEVLRALAIGYARYRRWTDAEQLLLRLHELRPDDLEVEINLGRLYVESEAYHKAIPVYRRLLIRTPTHFPSRLMLARSLIADARVAEAEPEFLAARQLRSDSPDPLIGLAQCAQERGDLIKAMTLLGQAYELDPSSVLAMTEMGNLQMQVKRYDLAAIWFERILRLDKRNKQAHLKLAQICRAQNRVDLAQQYEKSYEQLDQEEVASEQINRRRDR